jgi:Dihydrodipicolinate synthase/N-acetylneuraminate lyase
MWRQPFARSFKRHAWPGITPRLLPLQDRLMPLHEAMFAYPSPAPAKYVLANMGLLRGELRLPLVPVTDEVAQKIDAALAHAGV